MQKIEKILGAILKKRQKIITWTDRTTDGLTDTGQFVGPTSKVGGSKKRLKVTLSANIRRKKCLDKMSSPNSFP